MASWLHYIKAKIQRLNVVITGQSRYCPSSERFLHTSYWRVYSFTSLYFSCREGLHHNAKAMHVQPLLDLTRQPEQSGFVAGRSTMDTIMALHLLSDLHREFDRPLNVAYLDIKVAFDSVDRQAMWKALCSRPSHLSCWTSSCPFTSARVYRFVYLSAY